MSLTQNILYDAIDRLSTAQLAGIIGTDGISVDMVMLDGDLPHNREDVEIELSGLAAMASATAGRLRMGLVNELIIDTDYLTYLIGLITPGYYAVLGVERDSSLGRARFELREIVSRILNEL